MSEAPEERRNGNIHISDMTTAKYAGQLQQIQTTAALTASPKEETSENATDEVGISPLADLLSKLERLRENFPDQFKDTVKQLAVEVREQAESSDESEVKMFNDFAEKLETAAATGDLSVMLSRTLPADRGDFAVAPAGIYGPKGK